MCTNCRPRKRRRRRSLLAELINNRRFIDKCCQNNDALSEMNWAYAFIARTLTTIKGVRVY